MNSCLNIGDVVFRKNTKTNKWHEIIVDEDTLGIALTYPYHFMSVDYRRFFKHESVDCDVCGSVSSFIFIEGSTHVKCNICLQETKIRFSFDKILGSLKDGHRIRRCSWDKKVSLFYFRPHSVLEIKENSGVVTFGKDTNGADMIYKGSYGHVMGYIMMDTGENPDGARGDYTTYIPYSPSMSDILSEDWVICD